MIKLYCKECGNAITIGSKSGYCKSCSKRESRNSHYIDGRSKKKYNCRICNSIIGYAAYCYGDKTCRSCASKLKARKGKKNIFWGKISHGKWEKYKGSYMWNWGSGTRSR